MRFTAEQAAALQAKMTESYEAQQAAEQHQYEALYKEDFGRANLARQAMIVYWHDKVSPELLQLIAPEAWIVEYQYGRMLTECCLSESSPTPLTLEFDGLMLEIQLNENGQYAFSRGEIFYGAFDTPAEAEQEAWWHYGSRLAEHAKAEARRKREAEERCDFDAAIAPIINAVTLELLRASRKHGKIRNQHELYAVLLEELQEFWEEVRKAQVSAELSPEAVKELVQIAAMGLRGLLDLGAFKG